MLRQLGLKLCPSVCSVYPQILPILRKQGGGGGGGGAGAGAGDGGDCCLWCTVRWNGYCL